jgi:transcriptional regulator GlxA family with amidase domain
MASTRRIVLVAFDHVQALDVTGPLEVFSLAHRYSRRPLYELELIAPGGRPVVTSSGITLQPHGSLAGCHGPIDTIVVAGGEGVEAARADGEVIAWLRGAAPRARRVASVCTGAFLLAQAGLLDGRRATTHWDSCARLAGEFPAVAVDPEPIFVRDGHMATSAGVTAGIDLALALLEEDLGHRAALAVARGLVVFIRRPGSQAQFSAGLAGQSASAPVIRDLEGWMADHLDGELSVPALARRVLMSPRHFARVFKREVGLTPAAYVEAIRVERARALLETTDHQLEAVAARCGFGTVETMRRTFARHLQVSPSEYRERFAPARVIPIDARRVA